MQTKATGVPPLQHGRYLSLRACMCLVVLFVCLELLLHLLLPIWRGPFLFEADPELGYRLRPNLSARYRSNGAPGYYSVQTDAEGHRVVACSFPPTQPGELLLLGDSVAFGTSVNDDQTLAVHLAKAGFRVVNLAAPGYGTNIALLSFRRYMTRPHSVSWVVLIISPEAETYVRNSFRYMRHRPTASLLDGRLVLDPFVLPESDRFLDWSYLYAIYRWRLQATPRVTPGDGPRIVAACLASLKQETESAGARTLFVIADAMHPDKAIPFVEAAAERHVQLMDFSEELHTHIMLGEDLLVDDLGHWNPVGMKLVAGKLLSCLTLAADVPRPAKNPRREIAKIANSKPE